MMCFPLNNLQFKDYLHQIYPSELEIKETTDTPALASYLDLYLYIDNYGRLTSNLYDKHDDFDFPIVNFPFLSSIIPTSPAYGVYISQLIRYCRACNVYSDVLNRAKLPSKKLLCQDQVQPLLISSLQKFYCLRGILMLHIHVIRYISVYKVVHMYTDGGET
jgi:hypothetical protein